MPNHSTKHNGETSHQLLITNQQYYDEFVQSIRTPAVLRLVKPEAFTPVTVSIGPLHRHLCNPKTIDPISAGSHLHSYGVHHSFLYMERCKEIAVTQVFRFNEDLGSNNFDPGSTNFYAQISTKNIDIFNNSIRRINRFYSFRNDVSLQHPVDADNVRPPCSSRVHPVPPQLTVMPTQPLDLQSVLIRDSCFILEILRCVSGRGGGKEDKFRELCYRRISLPTRKALLLDLVLLENQVPLFLVNRVMACNQIQYGDSSIDSLTNMVKSLAKKTLPLCSQADLTANMVSESEHLLDCLYKMLSATSNAELLPGEHDVYADGDEEMGTTDRVRTATELRRAGVKFEALKSGSSLLGVKFDGRTLELPAVKVDGNSERLFRNLLAHETRGKSLVVMSYLHLMNGLINTEADVDILVEAGILSETLGDHQSVAQMWNRLTANTPRKHIKEHRKAISDAGSYVKKSLYVLMYEFQQQYLSRPWLVLSLLSGFALLVMTFLILYYTILLYKGESHPTNLR